MSDSPNRDHLIEQCASYRKRYMRGNFQIPDHEIVMSPTQYLDLMLEVRPADFDFNMTERNFQGIPIVIDRKFCGRPIIRDRSDA